MHLEYAQLFGQSAVLRAVEAVSRSGRWMIDRMAVSFVAAIVILLAMGNGLWAQDDPKESISAPENDAEEKPSTSQSSALEQKLMDQLAAARAAHNKKQEVGVLGEFGLFYFQTGQVKKAESQFSHALDLGLKVLGPNHPDIARCYANLGFLYEQTSDFRKAEVALLKASAILGKTKKDDSCLAKVLGALGDLYYAKGDYAKADQFYGRSLAMYQKLGINAGENIRIQENRQKLHVDMRKPGRPH